MLDFSNFPPEALHAYIAHYDLARSYPPSTSTGSGTGGSGSRSSPEEQQQPGEDDAMVSGKRAATRLRQRSPQQQRQSTAANDEQAEEEALPCPEHFADADAAGNYLGAVAGRHFAQLPPPKEGEVVVGFLYRCRAAGEQNRSGASLGRCRAWAWGKQLLLAEA